MRKKWGYEGPNQSNRLVTNLPEAQARQVVDAYRRRWSVERLVTELTGATALGQHQVSKGPQHAEWFVAISVVAYLMIVKCRARDIAEQGSWSLCTLKRNFAWQVAQGEITRSIEQHLRKYLQERNAA